MNYYYYRKEEHQWMSLKRRHVSRELIEVTGEMYEVAKYWQKGVRDYRIPKVDIVYHPGFDGGVDPQNSVYLSVRGLLIPVWELGSLESPECGGRVKGEISRLLLERERGFEDFYEECRSEFSGSWVFKSRDGIFKASKGAVALTRDGDMWKMKYSWKYSVLGATHVVQVDAQRGSVRDLLGLVSFPMGE